MLMKALLGHLFLDLTDGALCVDVCKLVLVNTRSCFLQETPLATAGNRRPPLCQAPALGQGKRSAIVLIARAGKLENIGKTEAEQMVAPFV